jgi:hypothetical protein
LVATVSCPCAIYPITSDHLLGSDTMFEDEDRKPTNRYYVREFLNIPGFHSTAYVHAEVTNTSPEFNSDGTENLEVGYLSFTLSDCTRQIHLSLDMHGQEERNNTRYKLDLLMKSMNDFYAAAVAEMDLADSRQAKREQRDRDRIESYRTAEPIPGRADSTAMATVASNPCAELLQEYPSLGMGRAEIQSYLPEMTGYEVELEPGVKGIWVPKTTQEMAIAREQGLLPYTVVTEPRP